MKKLVQLSLWITLVMASSWTLADTRITWTAFTGQSLSIDHKDSQTVRVNFGSDYLLLNQGKPYINYQGQMMELSSTIAQYKKALPNQLLNQKHSIKIFKTNKTKKVAGLQGIVYDVILEGKKYEVVIGDDPTIIKVQKDALGGVMKEIGGNATVMPFLKMVSVFTSIIDRGAVLSIGASEGSMALKSVETLNIPSSRFIVKNLSKGNDF